MSFAAVPDIMSTPEDSPAAVDERVAAQKRPAEDETQGNGTDEPKKKLSFGLKPQNKKISIGFNSLNKLGSNALSQTSKSQQSSGIAIKLSSAPKAVPTTTQNLKPKLGAVAAAFNSDDDDDEEMPPEAKMRMKNVGRDTPTSAGPNSFGKTRMGFCDTKKIYEKQLKKIQEELSEEEKGQLQQGK